MKTPLFLDTSIQVDRLLAEHDPEKRRQIEELLGQFQFIIVCAYSRLEFKRVVAQNLALTLRYLCEERSFFRVLERLTTLRRDRRVKTLVNIAAWLGHTLNGQIEVRYGEDMDQRLAAKAESFIRNSIRFIWARFDKAADSVADRMRCQRATEGPKITASGSLDVGIPEGRCRNRECNNANFFRENLPALRKLCARLEKMKESGDALTEELEKALQALRKAELAADGLYDYRKCLAIGDVWIHLECLAAGVKDFATKNHKESEVLCPLLGLTMHKPA